MVIYLYRKFFPSLSDPFSCNYKGYMFIKDVQLFFFYLSLCPFFDK